jgi:hypothetical protein
MQSRILKIRIYILRAKPILQSWNIRVEAEVEVEVEVELEET